MGIVRERGVAWFDKAHAAASLRGIVPQVTAIVIDYIRGTGTYAVNDDPAGNGRIRVTRDGIGAVLGTGDVVIGYVVIRPADREAQDDQRRANGKPVALRRAAGMKGPSRRGPKDFTELRAWLRVGGYTVAKGGTHWAVRDRAGTRIYTLSATASDRRALTNSVADLRRLTGLELKQ